MDGFSAAVFSFCTWCFSFLFFPPLCLVILGLFSASGFLSYLVFFTLAWYFFFVFYLCEIDFLTTAIIVQGPPGLPGLKGDPGSKGEKVSAPSFCRVCLCAVSFPRFEIGGKKLWSHRFSLDDSSWAQIFWNFAADWKQIFFFNYKTTPL